MYILRGLPGSGKSYLSKSLANDKTIICSADNYHVNQTTGLYEWSQNNQKAAHEYCYNMAVDAVNNGSDCIIDNTNINTTEYTKYVKLAEKNNYEVIILEPTTPWRYNVSECFRRCQHGVPIETILRMKHKLIGQHEAGLSEMVRCELDANPGPIAIQLHHLCTKHNLTYKQYGDYFTILSDADNDVAKELGGRTFNSLWQEHEKSGLNPHDHQFKEQVL